MLFTMPSKKRAQVKLEESSGSKDQVLVVGKRTDRPALHVLRRRGDAVEAGVLQAAEEGKPLAGELVRLTPTRDSSLLFDAETVYDGRSAEASKRTGPAQVASKRYRKNWDRVFRSQLSPSSPHLN